VCWRAPDGQVFFFPDVLASGDGIAQGLSLAAGDRPVELADSPSYAARVLLAQSLPPPPTVALFLRALLLWTERNQAFIIDKAAMAHGQLLVKRAQTAEESKPRAPLARKRAAATA
jgi:hypothetical protein